MTRQLIFVFLLLACGGLTAQTEQTLTNSARVRGGFGGPIATVSNLDGRWGGGAGGGGAFIVNDFFFGIYGQGETFGDWTLAGGERATVNVGSGGLWVGYTVPAHRLVHFYTSVKVGWGAVNASRIDRHDENGWNGNEYDTVLDDPIFTVQPEAGVELNLTHWFRLGLTGGYRFVDGVNRFENFSDADFSSPTVALTFRFGKFGY
jgi:hypothetical protein